MTRTRLKQALLDIINNVQTRATSFSQPRGQRAPGAQRQRHARSALQAGAPKTAPWQGFLYRFTGPRRSACWAAIRSNPSAGGDLNQDGDCDDTLLLDAAGTPSSRTTRVTS